MAKGEINLLYTEIDKLLDDICNFLMEEMQGVLSHHKRSMALRLIERSKQQQEMITKVLNTDTLSETSLEPYVDMKSYKVTQHQEITNHPDTDLDGSLPYEGTLDSLVLEDENVICPYINLPATEIKEGKTGYLYRKEKFLFFEQQKKCFATIQQTWLLIYMSESSLKPCQTFDLTRCKAKPSPTPLKDMKKRDESFELVNIINSKSCQFTAQTSKDMIQWVVSINQLYDSTGVKRNFPSIPKEDVQNERLSDESINDYEPLKDYIVQENKSTKQFEINAKREIIKKEPLPLPPRNTPTTKKIHHIPRMPSEESLDSNYDSVGPGLSNVSRQNSNSFSDDDSDMHYDNPTELKQKDIWNNFLHHSNNVISVNDQVKINNDEDDDDDKIYDYLDNPNIPPTKHNITDSKPLINQKEDAKKETNLKQKPTLKPKLLSLRYTKKSNV